MMRWLFYPMPHAGHPSGVLPALDFSVPGFLLPSTAGFSQELMIPAVTATSIAWRIVFEIFIAFDYKIIEVIVYSFDNLINGKVANEKK